MVRLQEIFNQVARESIHSDRIGGMFDWLIRTITPFWQWSVFIGEWPMFVVTAVISALAAWYLTRAWNRRHITILETSSAAAKEDAARLKEQVQRFQRTAAPPPVADSLKSHMVILEYTATKDDPCATVSVVNLSGEDVYSVSLSALSAGGLVTHFVQVPFLVANGRREMDPHISYTEAVEADRIQKTEFEREAERAQLDPWERDEDAEIRIMQDIPDPIPADSRNLFSLLSADGKSARYPLTLSFHDATRTSHLNEYLIFYDGPSQIAHVVSQ
jgi:hypothetical protein